MKREIFIGDVGIGGNHPVSIQSMTKVPLRKTRETLAQIERMRKLGCQIVRIGIPALDDIRFFRSIMRRSSLPVVADIHFDARLALMAIEAGAHGIRINPGNIGGNRNFARILHAAAERKIPVRIGANSGSLEKKSQRKIHLAPHEQLGESVLERVRFCEDRGFFDIKISLKSSSVPETVTAYRWIDSRCDYPLHIGVTEAGYGMPGVIKSAIGIGALLLDGIGNTLRVSLTEEPEKEIQAAWDILRVLNLRKRGLELISCPTCSRTSVDLPAKIRQFEAAMQSQEWKIPMKVAIMGCEVNGPGEAKSADVGIAFSRGNGFLFRRGKPLKRVDSFQAIPRLVEWIRAWQEEQTKEERCEP